MPTYYTNSVLAFGDDDAVTDTYTYQAFPMGLYREEDGKGYRFVKFDNGTGNVAAAANNLCYLLTPASWIVTSDESDATGVAFGAFVSVIADGSYGWVQTKGPATVATDGTDDIAKGDAVIAKSGAADGVVTRPTIAGANPTAAEARAFLRVIGVATADDSDVANTVAVYLRLE